VMVSCGIEKSGAFGHNDRKDGLLPTRIEAQHFGHPNIVSVAGGLLNSAAVTEESALYMWGEVPGLGNADRKAKLVSSRIAISLFMGVRIRCCHDLPPMYAHAFAMGTLWLRSSAAPTAATVARKSKLRVGQRCAATSAKDFRLNRRNVRAYKGDPPYPYVSVSSCILGVHLDEESFITADVVCDETCLQRAVVVVSIDDKVIVEEHDLRCCFLVL